MTPRPGDTPRLPLSAKEVKARYRKVQKAREAQASKPTPRALARGRYEAGLSGEGMVTDTCRVLDSVRVEGRVPVETWRRALQIMVDEADDELADRCPSWVDDPSGDVTWNGNDHGLRDN